MACTLARTGAIGIVRAVEAVLAAEMERAGGVDGVGELVEFGGLVQEARGTGTEVAFAVGRRGVVAEDDEGDAGLRAAHGAQHIEALPTFQLHVQHHDIGPRGEDAGDAGLRRFTLADHLQSPLGQQAGDPAADGR